MSDDMAALMALPDHLPILCWYADATGSIQWYSREWYRYTGTTPEGMAGWGWAKVHHTDTLGEVMLRWVACIAEVKPFCMIHS
jgi:PAS domain-containing protein